jgi:uncharacterized protein YabE (DUF348 family)
VPFHEESTHHQSTLGTLIRSRGVLVALATLVILALAGTTYGYAALSTSVTLTLDGQDEEVTVMGSTVGDILEAEGIEIGRHDRVAPSVDEEVEDGSRISVQFARPLELTVDGDTSTHWVTSTNVASALGEIGQRFGGAELSTSRGAGIDREGMTLEVVTPKKLTMKVAGKKPVQRQLTALTAKDALAELDVEVEKRDVVRPAGDRVLEDGDKVVFTDVRVTKKRVKNETVPHATIEREDSSMLEGETEVVRAGQDGRRDVTYRLTFRNGEIVKRTILTQTWFERVVDAIVSVGTRQAVTANYAGGGTVWDRLAQCEAGGNWATNTGNGYYGGLQFSLSTWRGYGGAGYPHQQSREYQIMIAERVRAADNGGYSAWPACSQSLGLPQ